MGNDAAKMNNNFLLAKLNQENRENCEDGLVGAWQPYIVEYEDLWILVSSCIFCGHKHFQKIWLHQ